MLCDLYTLTFPAIVDRYLNSFEGEFGSTTEYQKIENQRSDERTEEYESLLKDLGLDFN